MSDIVTTRAEILTADGRRASCDGEGWHSADHLLLDKLAIQAPLVDTSDDQVADAARAAVAAFGGSILLMKRKLRNQLRVGTASNLYRALTESSLQRALGVDWDEMPRASSGRRTRVANALLLGLGLTAVLTAIVMLAVAQRLG